jgi:hypothetical protein
MERREITKAIRQRTELCSGANALFQPATESRFTEENEENETKQVTLFISELFFTGSFHQESRSFVLFVAFCEFYSGVRVQLTPL